MAKRRTTSERRGVASIALVIVLVIAEFAILALVLGGSRDQDLTVARVSAVQAFYAAEAGMNMAMREVISGEDFDGDGTVGGITSTSATQTALHGASISVASSTVGSDITLTSRSEHILARQLFETKLEVTSTGGTIGLPYGIATNGSVSLSGSARIDALDSTIGVYHAGSTYSGKALLGSNTTTKSSVKTTGSSQIVGDVYVGVGANPASVIDTPDWFADAITGVEDVLTEPIEIGSITLPANLPPKSGNFNKTNSGNEAVPQGTYHYNNFSVSGSYWLAINGKVTIVCDGNFTLTNSAYIELENGATLTVYASRFSITGSARLNATSPADPSRVQLYQTGSSNFEVRNSGIVIGQVYAPSARVLIDGSGCVFGTVWADRLQIDNSGKFTQDVSLVDMNGSAGTGGEGTSAVVVSEWKRMSPQ